jgi:uncharacterized protein involved in propanediol utilization
MEYAIRVELRGNPSFQQYQNLHALLAKMGFGQTIKGLNIQGQTASFNLPHAVYFGSSTADISAVRNNVVTAIKSQIQQDIIVFVVQSGTWAIGS